MAISYPLSTPTIIGIESIQLREVNAVGVSQSPWTYTQEVIEHDGQKWEATVRLPSMDRALAAPWKAFLTSLKGPVGTFLLGDPDYLTPLGTVTSCTLTGSTRDETVTVNMTGSLLAGDYIQLGSGASAKLHTVLRDQVGSGQLEIWPALREDYTNAPVTFNAARGVFRLAQKVTSRDIDNAGSYGISFEVTEALV